MTQHFKIILRNIVRKPIYSIITFTGFTLGITVSLLIYLWIINELSYDKFHPDYQQIYRVLTLSKNGDEIIKSPMCYRPLPKTLKLDYQQIEYATYISYSSEDSPLHVASSGEKFEERGCWTNEDFFKIFAGFRFVEGSAENAFSKPENIVLSDLTARKLFGNQRALGKILIMDKYSNEVYTVGGVVRIPEQSTIDFGYILSDKNPRNSAFSNNWGDKGHVRVYLKLRKDAQIDSQFLSSISNQVQRYSKFTDKLMFQPLADIHLYSDYPNYMYDKYQSSYKYVWIFSSLAILIVIMAVLNFSTLSVARASERSVEIGIKKASGASKMNIFIQFMSESLLQTLVSSLIALLISFLILPLFNSLSSEHLSLNFSPGLFLNLCLLSFMVGIVSGIYPSVYLSSFNPSGIFKGGSISGSRSNFIRSLVTIQFTIAIFFIIATLIFIKQLNYVHNKDLGLDGKNVIVIPTGLWYDNKEFKEELLKNPRVLSVSASNYAPIGVGFKGTLTLSNMGSIDSVKVNYYFVDEDFAKTYKLEISKGQFLQMDYKSYWKEIEKSKLNYKGGEDYAMTIPIVINETASRLLRLKDPIGQRVGNSIIVGVVKDFHFRSLYFPIEPLVMSNNPEESQTMNVRISSENSAETLQYIQDVYKKHREGREFSYTFFDDLLKKNYMAEDRLRNITISFALLAIVISVLGILGMAIFSTDRRNKEIGIRRIAGAQSSEILVLLNKEFLKWVVISFVIASPIAWYVMHLWLRNFVYRTELSWWIFVMAGLVSLIIALLTVNMQSWHVATRNPVEALHYE
jgi:putative ABC transport system permease protein